MWEEILVQTQAIVKEFSSVRDKHKVEKKIYIYIYTAFPPAAASMEADYLEINEIF